MSLSTQRLLPNPYPIVPLHFFQDNLAASQTDVQLLVQEVTGAAGLAVDGYAVPWAGRIIGISYDLLPAGTTGSVTIGPTINGTEQSDPTLTVTTGTNGFDLASREAAPFTAGQRIGAEITTSTTWDGSSSDLAVTVWVLFEVTGVA